MTPARRSATAIVHTASALAILGSLWAVGCRSQKTMPQGFETSEPRVTSGGVILDETGRSLIMEGIVQDITERKEAEAELIWTRNEALSANAAKTQLLAMMSHELRTPLNAIIGFSEVMEKEVFGPVGCAQYKGYLRDISESGNHLLGLIQDILDAAMVERRDIDRNDTEFCLFTFLQETVRAVDMGALDGAARIKIESDDKPVRLFADRRLCRQMVSNLCRNALAYSPQGSEVVVSVSSPVPGKCLEISVIDRGYGISAEDLERVTHQFVRLNHTTASGGMHSGIGLGLYLVQQFIESHGGRLELESEIGKGTCARLVFPPGRIVFRSSDENSNDPGVGSVEKSDNET